MYPTNDLFKGLSQRLMSVFNKQPELLIHHNQIASRLNEIPVSDKMPARIKAFLMALSSHFYLAKMSATVYRRDLVALLGVQKRTISAYIKKSIELGLLISQANYTHKEGYTSQDANTYIFNLDALGLYRSDKELKQRQVKKNKISNKKSFYAQHQSVSNQQAVVNQNTAVMVNDNYQKPKEDGEGRKAFLAAFRRKKKTNK